MTMMLLKVHEREEPSAYRIERFPCVIGRSQRCDIRIGDLTVSQRHVELIVEEDGVYILRDLGSTNGIFVGNERITSLKITENESVRLGSIRVDFIVEEDLPKTRLNRLPLQVGSELRSTTPMAGVAALAAGYPVVLLPIVAEKSRLSWPPDHLMELLLQSLVVWALLGVAACVLAMGSRLSAKRFHFHRFFLILVSAVTSAELFYLFAPSIIYNLHNLAWAIFVLHLGFAGLCLIHLIPLQRLIFPAWHLRLRLLVGAAAAGLAALAVEAHLERRRGVVDGERMSDLGIAFAEPLTLKQGPDDLLFDLALSVAESDQRRIGVLEKIEADVEEDE